MYSYDRRKTAAQMKLWQEWREIVDNSEKELKRKLDELLTKTVPYLRSNGLDIDLQRSYLNRKWQGSDGWYLDGEIWVTDREENNVPSTDKSVSRWVSEALDTNWNAHARKVKEGPGKLRGGEPQCTWAVDISAY